MNRYFSFCVLYTFGCPFRKVSERCLSLRNLFIGVYVTCLFCEKEGCKNGEIELKSCTVWSQLLHLVNVNHIL